MDRLLVPLYSKPEFFNENSREERKLFGNEPAQNPDVRLFDARHKKDFLVVYNEYSERHDSIHTRAYFLNQNRKRRCARAKTSFCQRSFVTQIAAGADIPNFARIQHKFFANNLRRHFDKQTILYNLFRQRKNRLQLGCV